MAKWQPSRWVPLDKDAEKQRKYNSCQLSKKIYPKKFYLKNCSKLDFFTTDFSKHQNMKFDNKWLSPHVAIGYNA